MAGIDSLVEWVKGKIPAVLVSSFCFGVTCLTAAALVTKTVYTFEWRAVFGSASFLFTLAVVFFLWVATLATYWRAPSVRNTSRIGIPALLLCGGVTLYAAVTQSAYSYNEIGLYQSREWRLVAADGDARTFTSEIIAVQNLSGHPFLVTISIDPKCPQASIADFSPSLMEDQPYRPQILETTDPTRFFEARKWRIDGFQPPAKLLLIAKLRNKEPWTGNCFVYNLRWDAEK